MALGCSSLPKDAAEVFSSHCTSALSGHSVTVRALADGDQLHIEETGPRRTHRVRVAGRRAAELREKIAALELSPKDIDTMASQEIRVRGANGEDLVVLAPFDGVSYRFTIRGTRLVTVHNPASDPHFMSPPAEAARLRAVLELVDELSAYTRGNQAANKAPEPTPGLVTPRAMELDSEMKRRNRSRDAARGAPSPVVAHL